MPRTKGSIRSATFVIPKPDQTGPTIDKSRPAKLRKKLDFHDNARSFAAVNSAKGVQARLCEVNVKIGAGAKNVVTRFGSESVISAEHLEAFIAAARQAIGDETAEVMLSVGEVQFQSGHDLEAYLDEGWRRGRGCRGGRAMTARPHKPSASAVPTRPIPITSWSMSPPGGRGVVVISEHYGIKAGINGLPEMAERCYLPRAPGTPSPRTLSASSMSGSARRASSPAAVWSEPNRVERLLGKELLVLAWAIEQCDPGLYGNAVRNWTGLRPEERWWLYTMTAAATGRPEDAGVGWRKALRFALTENPLADPMEERTR